MYSMVLAFKKCKIIRHPLVDIFFTLMHKSHMSSTSKLYEWPAFQTDSFYLGVQTHPYPIIEFLFENGAEEKGKQIWVNRNQCGDYGVGKIRKRVQGAVIRVQDSSNSNYGLSIISTCYNVGICLTLSPFCAWPMFFMKIGHEAYFLVDVNHFHLS